MAYRPLSATFPRLTEVPEDLQALYQKMWPGKAKAIFGLLLDSPSGVRLGSYCGATGHVVLSKRMEVVVSSERPRNHSHGIRRTFARCKKLPLGYLDRAVASLRGVLRAHNFPYGLSATRCARGTAVVRGQRGGYLRPKKRVDFMICLVDKRLETSLIGEKSSAA